MTAVPASTLGPLVNGYTIRAGPPKSTVVPGASSLASLRDVAVSGTLLKKQVIAIDPRTEKRTVSLGAKGGTCRFEADGDLHFCLGVNQLQPHNTCEVQHAAAWLSTFQGSVGQPIVATGFLRCLFEHPGFRPNDDAHIFAIQPVYRVRLTGQSPNFEVLPDPGSIHTWLSPHPLNLQDEKIRVTYDEKADSLTFTNMDGQDENYVRVPGTMGQVLPRSGGVVHDSFTLTSPDIGHPIQVFVLEGTNAAAQMGQLAAADIVLVALRGIEITQALAGKYVIRLLAVDIQPGA